MWRPNLPWARRAATCLMMSSAPTLLALGGTIADGPVSFVYPPSQWSGLALANLYGTEANPAKNVLSSCGWWYRVEGTDTQEHPLPPPDTEEYRANGSLALNWANVDGKGFKLGQYTKVIDGEGPSGALFSSITVEALPGGPSVIHLFHFLVPDLGTLPNDSVAVLTNRYLKFTNGTSVLRYRTDSVGHFKVAPAPTLLGLLNNTTVDNLDDAGTPAGQTLAAAYQFTLAFAGPTDYANIRVAIAVNTPHDHVRSDAYGVGTYSDLLARPLGTSIVGAATTQMARSTVYYGFYPVWPGEPWQFLAHDDFDGDYTDEPVYRNPGTGAILVGASPLAGAAPPPANWTMSATGDFNADGKADIIWRNQTSQKLVAWTMNGAQKTGNITPSPDQAVDANWDLAGAGDFNGDGHRDFLWYNQTTGKLVIWYMNASLVRISGNFTNPSSVGDNNWRAVAVGDYGKGVGGLYDTQDIVWRNDTSRKIVIWYMDHSGNRTSGVFTTPDDLGFGPGVLVMGPR